MQTASSRSVIAQCHCQWVTAKCRRGLHIIAHKPTAIHKVLLTALQKRHAELPRRSSWLAHKPPWFRVGWNKVQPSLLDHCPNRGGHSETRQTTAAAATHVSAADSHPTSPHLGQQALGPCHTALVGATQAAPADTAVAPRQRKPLADCAKALAAVVATCGAAGHCSCQGLASCLQSSRHL